MDILSTLRPIVFRYLLVIIILLIAYQDTPVVASQAVTDANPPLAGPHVLITIGVNIRSAPNIASAVLGLAEPGQRFVITGRSADGAWWRIDYQGQEAWVFAEVVQAIAASDLAIVPAASQSNGNTANAATVLIVQFMYVRSGPGTTFAVIATAQPERRYAITGKNATGTWWRIDYEGQTGWVSASLVQAENSAAVAVVDADLAATPTAPPSVALPTPTPVVTATALVQPSPTATPNPITDTASSLAFDPTRWRFRLEPIIEELTQPIFVTHAGDGSGRLFVVEKVGRIEVYSEPNGPGTLFLDISERVGDSGSERGLLGLAFAANFVNSGYFFVNYTNNDGDTVIARYQISAKNPDQADATSEFVILTLDQPAGNHNGGMLLFGPDGYLWVGTGDGGGSGDTYRNGQNPDTLLGKMLRLDVLTDPETPYQIPSDNPWVAKSWKGRAVQDEIWAIGLRNPWRYSFDRRTGDLWIGDVGQNRYEEIHYIPAAQVATGGLNFGWPIWEGMHCFRGATCESSGFIAPVAEYNHEGNGCSVTGGYVYRGEEFPQIEGIYFYADYCSGNLWAYWRNSRNQAQSALIFTGAGSVSSFGEDESGELYVVDYRGGVVSRLIVEEKSR